MGTSYLFTIPYRDLSSWGYGILSYNNKYDFRFPMLEIGQLLTQYKEKAILKDDVPYKRITIKLHNSGVVLRDITYGKDIKTQGQFYIKKGQFIYSQIDARNGAFGIVPDELDGAIITNSFCVFDFDSKKIDLKYLNLLLCTDYFLEIWQDLSVGTTNRRSVKVDKFLDVKIPVPSIEEQHEIVARYNANMLRIELIKDEYSYWQIERFIENYLELKNVNTHNNQGILNFSYYTDLLTWDVRNRTNQQVFETSRYKLRSLKTLAEVNPALTKKLNDNEDVSFVPMECVSDLDGVINEYRTCKAGRKGFTKFENRDIIWAKITPCMQNGKSAVVNNLKNGIGYGSTEFYVIRPNKAIILPEYLHYLLRMYRVREEAVNYFSGSAGQQRVRRSFLENLNIPVPSIEEQKYLVSKLDELKLKIIKNRETIQNLQNQAQSDFESAIFEV